MNERKFSVVFGYLKDIDNWCRDAKNVGLTKRLAIVLDSYRSSSAEMYYDYGMFHDILKLLVGNIVYDSLEVVTDSKLVYTSR
jgi:hypothetical protein